MSGGVFFHLLLSGTPATPAKINDNFISEVEMGTLKMFLSADSNDFLLGYSVTFFYRRCLNIIEAPNAHWKQLLVILYGFLFFRMLLFCYSNDFRQRLCDFILKYLLPFLVETLYYCWNARWNNRDLWRLNKVYSKFTTKSCFTYYSLKRKD